MKNLFLTCAMFLVFGSAVAIAQETPKKSSTSDTITKKKSTKGSKKNSSTYKTDTIHKQHRTDKTNKTKTMEPTTSPRKDSIGIKP